MKKDFDLIVTGSGFAGSLLAMVARRIGLSVLLIERGSHPRFAIGESTSPLMNLILEQLAARYDLPRLAPLTSYGAWQRTYPDIVCGLKRGFTYYKQEAGQRFHSEPDRQNQLLVAASPNDEVADTHWLRADVDAFLVREAQSIGVEYADFTEVRSIEWQGDAGLCLTAERMGAPLRVRARWLVDASGPRGLLSRFIDIGESGFESYPATQALYSHFTDVPRCDEMPEYDGEGAPPYPADDAALHHVFDGGWMWVLRFNNGVTSAGIAVTEDLAAELRLSEGEAAWRRFLSRFPSIGAQFAEAKAIREFTWMPRLSYRAPSAAGPQWALLPSAAAFVDPLFSTGMPLALLGVERLGRIFESRGDLAGEYAPLTVAEADHTARFIAGCYAAFPRFECFASYSMFYFAAASYSEMARRLDRGHLVRRFLASDHAPFAAATRAMGQSLRQAAPLDATDFTAEVRRAIAPLNVAGLCVPEKRNWYGVDLQDVIEGAEKLAMTPSEMRAALQALGL